MWSDYINGGKITEIKQSFNMKFNKLEDSLNNNDLINNNFDGITLHEIFLTRAESDSIGLSAIGSRIMKVESNDDYGLHIELGGKATRIIAPVAPGLISEVDVHSWSRIPMNKPREITFRPCTIALDGERSLTVNKENTVEVLITDKGPRVASIKKTLNIATELGMFRNDYL